MRRSKIKRLLDRRNTSPRIDVLRRTDTRVTRELAAEFFRLSKTSGYNDDRIVQQALKVEGGDSQKILTEQWRKLRPKRVALAI